MNVHARRLMSLSLFFVLVFSGFMGLLAEEAPSLEIIQAARKGICDFSGMEALPGQLSAAASHKAAWDDAEVHHGFQVYTVSPVELMRGTDLTPLLTPTGLWRFVVLAEGQPVSLVTVAQVEGKWTAVSVGGAILAGEVSRVMEKWPVKDGYSHRFLRVYQARADFIEIFRDNRSIGFVPLIAARETFGITGGLDPAAVLHDSEVLKSLKHIVYQRMTGIENRK